MAEAHALDTENCPSNCPDLPIPGPHGEYMLQHVTVQDRMDAAQIVMDVMGPDATSTWNFPFDDILIDSPATDLQPLLRAACRHRGHRLRRRGGGPWRLAGGIPQQPSESEFPDEPHQQPRPCLKRCLLVDDSQEPCSENALDSDGDGVCDQAELILGTDPFNPCDLGEEGTEDSDGDGSCDALETLIGTDPLDPCDPLGVDTDGDGFCDLEEDLMGSNPFNACSPSNSDQDGDGYCDNEEIAMGSDMLDPCSPDGTDSDLDGLCNSQELASGSDPNDTCDPFEGDADGDGLCDHLEGIIGSSAEDPCSPYGEDADGDGFCDILETLEGWDADNACSPDGEDSMGTDGDGMERANGWNEPILQPHGHGLHQMGVWTWRAAVRLGPRRPPVPPMPRMWMEMDS